MAEIKIEKKKPIWPWILGLLVVLGIILFLFYATNNNDDYMDDTNTNQPVMTDTITDNSNATYNNAPSSNTTTEYKPSSTYLVNVQKSLNDSMKLGTDSIYTAKAFYNLANASASKAVEMNLYSSPALSSLESDLNQFKSAQMGQEDFSKIDLKTLSSEITAVISEIQNKNAPNLDKEVSNLKTLSNELNSSTDWTKQQKNIQDYLNTSYEILTTINY
ncbi:hypothetical protein BN863_9150 [Formosa agariphila KMM 3901]|uniref:Uncharacterized protein n=1 Tax=Formosa agariphila (strain DSM 15362 / KCTC 12365 / LMG 23005 / KMM 3901 / M-2Alg 35-1) TaxID=1347342 RepID=T2KIC9_FORAG|nr:hypothetical protein [Formosa agariphila]CDF78627.1 hypothetical protein BN863_9150 [Formosa agariphila KMM 3901]